jgi:phosphomannomutase
VRKVAIPVPPSLLYSALTEFRDAVEGAEGLTVDHTDGVKLLWPDGWVHVRASNTQSLGRIIAEAEEPRRAQELLDWARERLKA